MEVSIRALTGEQYVVSVATDATVKQVKQSLAQQRQSNSSLYCRGVALQNEQAVAALYLANGEFLTAVPVQKRKGAKTAKVSGSTLPSDQRQQRAPATSTAAGQASPSSTLSERQVTHAYTSTNLHSTASQQPESGEAAAQHAGQPPQPVGQQPQGPTAIVAQAAQPQAAAINIHGHFDGAASLQVQGDTPVASPTTSEGLSEGGTYTLLPGYTSRPNPSPAKRGDADSSAARARLDGGFCASSALANQQSLAAPALRAVPATGALQPPLVSLPVTSPADTAAAENQDRATRSVRRRLNPASGSVPSPDPQALPDGNVSAGMQKELSLNLGVAASPVAPSLHNSHSRVEPLSNAAAPTRQLKLPAAPPAASKLIATQGPRSTAPPSANPAEAPSAVAETTGALATASKRRRQQPAAQVESFDPADDLWAELTVELQQANTAATTDLTSTAPDVASPFAALLGRHADGEAAAASDKGARPPARGTAAAKSRNAPRSKRRTLAASPAGAFEMGEDGTEPHAASTYGKSGQLAKPRRRRAAKAASKAATDNGQNKDNGAGSDDPDQPDDAALALGSLPQQLTAKQATAVAKLPLTAELERLVAIFGALNAVYGFLLRQHIQATWHTVREALRSLPGGSSAQLEDIKLMAELCPDVVHLRAQEMLISPVRTMQQRAAVAAAAQAAAQAVPASPQTGTVAQEPSTTANQSASPTSSAATAAGELPAGVVGHPSVEASGFGLARDGDVIEFRTPTASPIRVNTANPLELFTDGSGTILEGECNRYVIEIVDPGRRKAPATASLSTLGGQDLDGGLTDEAGLLSGSLGASGEPLKQQTDRGAKNAMQRRARAFRQALVRHLYTIHADFLATLHGQQQPAAVAGGGGAAGLEASASHLTAAQYSLAPGQGSTGGYAGDNVAAHSVLQQAETAAGALPEGKPAIQGHAAEQEYGSKPPGPPAVPLRRVTRASLRSQKPEAQQQRSHSARDTAKPSKQAGMPSAAASQRKRKVRENASNAHNPGPASNPVEQPPAAAADPTADKLPGVFPSASAAVATAAVAASATKFDPLKQGRWHSLFPLDQVSLDLIRKAAADAHAKAALSEMLHLGDAAKVDDVAAGRGHQVQARPPQIMRKHQPCTDCTPMDTNQFLDHLRSLPWYCGQAVHCEQIAARKAKLGLPQYQLSPPVQQALQKRGVDKLFSHQAQAVDAIMSGQHVVVSTSTASGKSLCYNIPILEALAADRHACAIYMFPTKALAQDQMRALRELCQLAFGPNGPHVDVYDGDTLKADRGEIRERAQLLITNPDMLHLSILPVHRTFARILANLKYVVVDEGHAYRGVFGCHTALVLRRLRRLCERQYNSLPRFVVTSATVANPQHHVQDLLGVPGVRVVSEDGSPHGPKCFVLWNPPLTAGQEALNSKGGKGMLSNTEMRARGRKMGKRAEQEFVRSEVREANQDRGRGAKLGPQSADALDEAAWMSTVRAGRRRGAVVQTASAALAAAKAVAGQQPGAAGDAALDPEAAAVAGQGPHTGSDMASGSSRAPAKLDPAAVQRAAAAVAAAVVPRSKGVLTYSAQDLEHRHDDAIQVRPLIRRQATHGRYDKPPDPRIKHRGAQPVEPPKPANPGASGGQWIDPGPKREAWKNPAADPQVMDVQKRLPGTNWRERYGAAGTAGEQRRSSPIVELSMLLAECIQHGLRTIAFCMTRKLCELVTAYTREMLKSTAPHLAKSISVYRAGYSPQERREIERALFNGELWAVAATNALELGVDVGSLDVTLHLGFPGSVASLWQQAGRAGRREQPSMSIYIAFDGPMDQYFMTHPDKLFSRSIENAQVDPQNAQLLGQHLTCAAAECPLLPDEDQRFFGPTLPTIASGLTTEGLLARHPQTMHTNALHYIGPRSNPAAGISLRAIDPERYAIVNEAAGGEVMEEIEESKAFYEVYDGAVYMFQGRTYLCKKLDLASKVAVVRPADLKYYTKTRDFCDVHVTGDKALYPAKEGNSQYPETTAAHAPADVTVRWLGFHRIWQGSGEVFDTVDLFLPDVQYSTQAAYIRVPASARQRVQQAGLPFRDGLHAASHALLNVLPLYMMCNPHDMGTECDNPYDTRFRPERLLLYDKHPGGIGLAAQACPLFGELMQKALELLHNCPCQSDSGCPSCIQHTDCGEYNAVLHKGAGKIVLECTLQAEDEYRERRALQEAAAAAGNDAPPDFALVERTGGDVDGLMNNLAVPDYD